MATAGYGADFQRNHGGTARFYVSDRAQHHTRVYSRKLTTVFLSCAHRAFRLRQAGGAAESEDWGMGAAGRAR